MPTSSSADEDALVREILADPWDTLARSVYADWLEDSGRPHHAELARYPAKRDDERVDTDGYWQKARAAAPKAGIRVIHRSGFAAAQMTGRELWSKEFAAKGAAWLREHRITWLEVETLSDWGKAGPVLAAAGTRGLRLLGRVDKPGDLSCLAGLQALTLSDGAALLGWLEAMAGCDALASLVRLSPGRVDRRNPDALRKLGHGPLAGGLRHLDLSGSWVGEEEAIALIESPMAESLVTLNLAGCWLHPKTAAAIAASPRLGRLRNLDLANNYLRNEGNAALARWPHLPRLHRLRIPDGAHGGGSAVSVAALREILGDRLIVG